MYKSDMCNTIEQPSQDDTIRGIIGAIIGDISGSRFEGHRAPKSGYSNPKYLFLAKTGTFTDDTVMIVAVADALLHDRSFGDAFRDWGRRYPAAGWGGRFRKWLHDPRSVRNNSVGNGSGMRVCAVGFHEKTLDDVLERAKESARPSHDSHEGVAAAQAVASAVFLARQGDSKETIRAYIENKFYNLNRFERMSEQEILHIRDGRSELAANSVPFAILAFLNGNSYEEVVRKAVGYGIDTDTVAAMAGGIAAAYYGVPRTIAEEAAHFLPQDILDVVNEFDGVSLPSPRITPSNINCWGNNCIVVYGCNADETEGEKGFGETRTRSRFNRFPKEGYPIHTIGTPFETVRADVEGLIAHVNRHPEKIFLIEDFGIGKKSNLGIDRMASLLRPLADKENVFMNVAYRVYFNVEEGE